MVYRDSITSLSDHKESTERYVGNIPQFMLLLTVEHAILRFQMVANNEGHHIEYVLSNFVDYLHVFNNPKLRHLGVVFETHCFFFSR